MLKNDPLPIESTDLPNKLFASFTLTESLERTLSEIQQRYSVLSSRVFVLESEETSEFICTYSVDTNNLNDNALLDNTILVHRKKDVNCLYSINALNVLVASLNNGKPDPTFRITWSDYKNCILLTREGQFSRLNTKVKEIVYLN